MSFCIAVRIYLKLPGVCLKIAFCEICVTVCGNEFFKHALTPDMPFHLFTYPYYNTKNSGMLRFSRPTSQTSSIISSPSFQADHFPDAKVRKQAAARRPRIPPAPACFRPFRQKIIAYANSVFSRSCSIRFSACTPPSAVYHTAGCSR